MIYSIRHTTTFRYDSPVRESIMEVRMQPRTDARQRCLKFHLDVEPSANIMEHRDFLQNTVHHFDIAESHAHLKITANAVVEMDMAALDLSEAGDWAALDEQVAAEDYWEMLLPSTFATPTDLLMGLARELRCERRGTPLELLTELNGAIYGAFAYVPNSTSVDSPIDVALEARKGVCQDFAHIMIALVRSLGIPCRYVSGYLFRSVEEGDSERTTQEGASHAWVEAMIPGVGWIAFDPTNNSIGKERHIQVAIGRDYADIPPTRGIYKGDAQSELSVAVTVSPANAPPPAEMAPSIILRAVPVFARVSRRLEQEQQQQQQQQQ